MLLSRNAFLAVLAGIAIFGMVSLVLLEQIFAPQKIQISEINDSLEGKKIIAIGQAKNSFARENTLFFDLENNGKIKAVKFSPSKEEIILANENRFLQVTARVQKFRGNLELIVQEMKKID